MEVFQENYFENERKVLEGYWRRRWRFATRNLDSRSSFRDRQPPERWKIKIGCIFMLFYSTAHQNRSNKFFFLVGIEIVSTNTYNGIFKGS